MRKEKKEQIIQGYVEKLGINRQEAEQLFEDDYSNEVLPEVAEMEEKAKELGRHYEMENKKRKPSTRERKIDNQKKEIIATLVEKLKESAEVTNIKTETEISFSQGGEDFTIKLIKHRKKKTN